MPSDPHYWFPAKRYGWDWGFPVSWEGWIVLAVFVALLVGGVFLFPPNKELGRFIVYTSILCVLLVAVGWLKGEPPRWRWGGE
jgi:hypothetical protein